MTVAHKNLTGVNLHEPKGIATATIDKVYVSDGAGSGAWQKITAAQLDANSGGNPFGSALLHIRDNKANGVAGGSATQGAIRTRTLNATSTALTNEITGASLISTTQLSLPAGTYWIEARSPGYACGTFQSYLYNVTSATYLFEGSPVRADAASAFHTVYSFIEGRFTLGVTSTLEHRYQCQSSAVTNGLGYPASLSGQEIYGVLKIWKL